MANELIDTVLAGLSATRRKVLDAYDVPDSAGLYALHGSNVTWNLLGLGAAPDARPLYVGKAERSLSSRDLNTHFRSGCTGQSTVRRTFAALLRGALALRAVPRNLKKPYEKPTHFSLDEASDAKLTEWMLHHLELAVWPKPMGSVDLAAIEAQVILRWSPPLNIQGNAGSSWIRKIRAARQRMALDSAELGQSRRDDAT